MADIETRQYSTFFIGDLLYGIDVMQVQEVTKSLPITPIPLSPKFIEGLINLRGQIATAIDLANLFDIKDDAENAKMNVVCRIDGVLLSLLVDRIGDVVEVSSEDFESPPDTIPTGIKKFMAGVYKTQGPLLSIIEVNHIVKSLNSKVSNTSKP